MAGKLNSISAKDISAAVRKAADRSPSLKAAKALGPSLTTIRPPIMGFVLRDSELKGTPLSELNQIASDVAGSLGAGDAKVAAFLNGGHIIIGFVEEPSITILAE